jgi:DNA uptake protein ComE-like DNA-binding protein
VADESKKTLIDHCAAWIVGLLVLVIIVDISVITYRKTSPTQPIIKQAQMDFKWQFDPNKASVGELEYLPGLTTKIAQAIVNYREEVYRYFPDRKVFSNLNDLKKVKGLTEKKLVVVKDFLIFPNESD